MYFVQVNDFAHWRKQARELLKRRIAPEQITWRREKQASLPLGDSAGCFSAQKIHCPHPTIPRDFFYLAEQVACYRDESRWSLLYSLAWRLLFEDRNLLACITDDQVARLWAMKQAVARDSHKMKAFVRFRSMDTMGRQDSPATANSTDEEEYFVSWFEPEHLIVPLIAPFFVKRFNTMNWSILTPDTCVHWNREQVILTEGVSRPPAVDDELEDLWREYYASIFNPARLKLKAMQSEMPKKYWINLPEAPLIAELTRTAGNRVDTMIAKGSSEAWAKTAKSRYIRDKRRELIESGVNNVRRSQP